VNALGEKGFIILTKLLEEKGVKIRVDLIIKMSGYYIGIALIKAYI
jgi:hypothetical protein